MDQQLLFLINREWTAPALDRVMTIASSFSLWVVPCIFLVIAIMIRGGFRARAFLLVATFAVLLCDGVSGYGIKRAVGRFRPHETEFGVRQLSLSRPHILGAVRPLQEMVSLGDSDATAGRSFPSNHSANTACLALLVALFFRRAGWLAFFPALLVSYSRVYVGSHWPSDVVAGICVGFAMALIALLLAEMLWRRFAPRHLPAFASRHPSLLSSAA